VAEVLKRREASWFLKARAKIAKKYRIVPGDRQDLLTLLRRTSFREMVGVRARLG
jgi:hypothetical protein